MSKNNKPFVPEISTCFDDYTFDNADNPIVQFKDALEARSPQAIKYISERLDKILDGSLFRLSVHEFASFVRHEPNFERFNDEQKYNIMLFISLFAQVAYPKSCLPDLDYQMGIKPGHHNVKILQTLSTNIAQVQPEGFYNYDAHAFVLCKVQTYSDNRDEGLTFDDAEQAMQFYVDHYNVDYFTLYDEDDHAVAFLDLKDGRINAIDTSLDAEPFDLASHESYTLEIKYEVDVNKLPIVVNFELKDCAQKAFKFAQQIQHVKENTNLEFRECLLKCLIDLNKLNMTHPHTIRNNVKKICDGNNNFDRNIYSAELAKLCNGLLNDFLSIAGI